MFVINFTYIWYFIFIILIFIFLMLIIIYNKESFLPVFKEQKYLTEENNPEDDGNIRLLLQELKTCQSNIITKTEIYKTKEKENKELSAEFNNYKEIYDNFQSQLNDLKKTIAKYTGEEPDDIPYSLRDILVYFYVYQLLIMNTTMNTKNKLSDYDIEL